MNEAVPATQLQLGGAFCFGLLIGWYIYYINRYRKSGVSWNDLVTLIGIVGGGTILTLFKSSTDLFGAYGIGLAAGFFLYFIFLIIWVLISKNFTIDWFLDGRRTKLSQTEYIPEEVRSTTTAMGEQNAQGGPRT